MSFKNIDQVYDVARIRDEYIVSHLLDGDDRDTHGWVQGSITDFEIDEDDDQLDMLIELPWGETHCYNWDTDKIFTGQFSDVCSSYGCSVSEFERLRGKDIWLKVRYIEIDDSGEINTGTRMNYKKPATGPNHWKKYGKFMAVMLIVLIIVLMIL